MGAVTRDRTISGAGTAAQAWQGDAALAAVAPADASELVPPGARLVIVAPHPDDEILACGGLLQLLAADAQPALLVAVTDGEASHPGSSAWPAARLRAERPHETLAALDCLGIARPALLRCGIADGGVSAREAGLAQQLAEVLGPHDVVVTTWRYDGHPDHEATARACAAASARCGARLLEVPVWGWHWSTPADAAMPLAQARKLPLPEAVLARKRAAMACFKSQVLPDASRAAEAVVPAHALDRILMPFELYFHEPARAF
jgi:LmbE family N-acetylglucosaminyl deacetylase